MFKSVLFHVVSDDEGYIKGTERYEDCGVEFERLLRTGDVLAACKFSDPEGAQEFIKDNKDIMSGEPRIYKVRHMIETEMVQ